MVHHCGEILALMLTLLSRAWRSWNSAKGAALLAIFALAIGIGSSTAIYTLVYSLLLNTAEITTPTPPTSYRCLPEISSVKHAGLTEKSMSYITNAHHHQFKTPISLLFQ